MKKCYKKQFKTFLKSVCDENLFCEDMNFSTTEPKFAFILKTKGSDRCYSEPRFQYYCDRCKVKSWLE